MHLSKKKLYFYWLLIFIIGTYLSLLLNVSDFIKIISYIYPDSIPVKPSLVKVFIALLFIGLYLISSLWIFNNILNKVANTIIKFIIKYIVMFYGLISISRIVLFTNYKKVFYNGLEIHYLDYLNTSGASSSYVTDIFIPLLFVSILLITFSNMFIDNFKILYYLHKKKEIKNPIDDLEIFKKL